MRLALALGASLFVVYALGACPTIYVGDSGELVTAVAVLGIPHPTGYPLYVLLGKLWTLLLPAGSVAWRMSLFSAVAAAAACAGLANLCRRLGVGPVASVFGAGLLAASPSFWGEANVQRVYALGALFVVLATSCAVAWQRRRDVRSLALAFFVCGLGAANHMYMAVYALALAAFVVTVEPGILRRPTHVAAALAAFGAGLLPYLYLPLRSRADPVLDWGNPETLGRLLDVVTRRRFWTRAWLEGPADLPPILADYLQSIGSELGWAGAALALLGLAAGRRRGWPMVLLVLALVGNVAAVALHGSRSDIFVWHRYYIPSYVLLALFAAAGCDALVARLPRFAHALPLLVPALMLLHGWPRFDRSRYRVAEDFAAAVLASLPPGAHLIASDDNVLFALMYLHLVEGRRPDVDLVLEGVSAADLKPLRFDPDRDPLFFTHHPDWDMPGLSVAPVGLVFAVARAGSAPRALAPPPVTLAGEDDPRVPKDHLTENLIGHFHYMLGITHAAHDWPHAERELRAAAAAAPQNDVLFYNLALVLLRNGLYDAAAVAAARSAAINPRHLASAGRPRAADLLAEIDAERTRIAGLEAAIARDPVTVGLARGTAPWHGAMATLLDARGERVAARGHRLRATGASAVVTSSSP